MSYELEVFDPLAIAEAPRPSEDKHILKRMRDSHHALARLVAAGVPTSVASVQTGYAEGSIRVYLQDTSFKELIEFYRTDARSVQTDVEELFLLSAREARAILQERMIERPETVSTSQALDIFKAMADRAGYAPVQRTINKNLNVSIGDRLDAARKRRVPPVEDAA